MIGAKRADNPPVLFDMLLAALRSGGRDFERVCKWLLENVPEYRPARATDVRRCEWAATRHLAGQQESR